MADTPAAVHVLEGGSRLLKADKLLDAKTFRTTVCHTSFGAQNADSRTAHLAGPAIFDVISCTSDSCNL